MGPQKNKSSSPKTQYDTKNSSSESDSDDEEEDEDYNNYNNPRNKSSSSSSSNSKDECLDNDNPSSPPENAANSKGSPSQSGKSMRRRVKVYMLSQQRQWDDKGTGYIETKMIDLPLDKLLTRPESVGTFLKREKQQEEAENNKGGRFNNSDDDSEEDGHKNSIDVVGDDDADEK